MDFSVVVSYFIEGVYNYSDVKRLKEETENKNQDHHWQDPEGMVVFLGLVADADVISEHPENSYAVADCNIKESLDWSREIIKVVYSFVPDTT